MQQIRSLGVIGAGTMGSGIAAHAANAGLQVVVLDVDAATAAKGVERQQKAGGFMHPSFASRIATGSIKDLALLSDCDWIVEAVAEQLAVKRAIYSSLHAACKPGAIVSSNTSAIPISALTEGQPLEFAQQFLITHFFNPPRRMRLLEVVSGPETSRRVLERIVRFADERLGKSIVFAKDTPGFIANRIGTYWMVAAVQEATARRMHVEDADALMGSLLGIPSTGVFGLLDLVGIDLLPQIIKSMDDRLPKDDPLSEYAVLTAATQMLIQTGRTGRKSGAGYYRTSADRATREAVDLATGAYRPRRQPDDAMVAAAKRDLRSFLESGSAAADFTAAVLEKTLAYAASLIPAIAESPAAIDEAMRLGYAWRQGPFELIDRQGAPWLVERLRRRGLPVPGLLAEAATTEGFYRTMKNDLEVLLSGGRRQKLQRQDGVTLLSDIKLRGPAVSEHESASLWDMGDAVGLIEARTKLGVLGPALIETLHLLLDRSCSHFRALVIGNDSPHFSAGADLAGFIAAAQGNISIIAKMVDRGQELLRRIKFSPVPFVAAVSGYALGGGCELALHAAAIQAFAETNIGLVETLVGLVPAWGGCKELLLRLCGRQEGANPVDIARAAFALVSTAQVSSSAYDAKTLGFLRATDGVTMNRDRLLSDAKSRALELAKNYSPPTSTTIVLLGTSGVPVLTDALKEDRDAGRLSAHDWAIRSRLIDVLTAAPLADSWKAVTEDEIFALEKSAFVDLFVRPMTQERIQHMLKTRKPLRN